MKETLFNARGLDETRVKRAFSWVVTFRDFPVGSYQTVDGDSMMTEALTLFTKGRAHFYLDGERRNDRVPGVLSIEHEIVGKGGTFKLEYVEPTTRLCIPAKINDGKLPTVSKIMLEENEELNLEAGNYLVCLGGVLIASKTFLEEQQFTLREPQVVKSINASILLRFYDARK